MSDLYDSLEDERDEYKLSSDFLGRRKTHSSDSVRWDCKSDSTDKYSFFLNQNTNKENHNLQSIFQYSNLLPEKKNFLPQIKNFSREEGPETVSNAAVDSKSLNEQGLQLNDDGSFTKSPREIEELPFITREYRNLQFQKKKTYKLTKKSPVVKQQKKNIFSFTDPSNGINVTQQITERKKKEPNQELFTSERSLSCKDQQVKQSASNSNLTDSMKEKLLGTLEKQPNKLKGIKLTSKREMNPPESNASCHQKKISAVVKRTTNGAKLENVRPQESLYKNSSYLVGDTKKSKNVPLKIPKYKSDILLNGTKPRLNYSERQQLKSGFNPSYLRHENKKILSDTNRSNFGDSEMEELPEVSSRVLSCDNLRCEEEEEMFYMKLIREDRFQKQTQQSSRSEGRIERLSLKRISGTDSREGVREAMSGRNNTRCKDNLKPLFIDMPSEKRHSVSPLKKSPHYCSAHSSPNISKIELALKAKTYGYLANARNIFKLKAQSEGKLNATEREKQKINEDVSPSSSKKSWDLPTSGKLTKRHSLPVNEFPKFKAEFLKSSPKNPRRVGSLCEAKQPEISGGRPKTLALPQVNNDAVVKGGKMNARLFERINYCLRGPNV